MKKAIRQSAVAGQTTLRISAARQANLESFQSASVADGIMEVEALGALQMDSARAGTEPVVIPNLPDDTVVQIELEGGIRLWMSVEELRSEVDQSTARGGTPGELVLPSALRIGAPTRGLGTLLIKGLRLFNVKADRLIARKISQYWENKTLRAGPGFFRLAGGRDRVELTAPGPIPTDRPILVFIHGTASSTEGSFGQLWAKTNPETDGSEAPASPVQKGVWEALRQEYGEHIYALEHKTLTVSPIQNALDLANALPTGARLHLVSHSRGGLVGELLCRGSIQGDHEPFDEYALKLFSGEHYQVERQRLVALGHSLVKDQKPRLRIERFVRVACPARGTSLASGRLDTFFSLLAAVVGRAAPPSVGWLAEAFTDLAVALAKVRTDPRELPGLEAMIPDSPLVRLLNTATAEVDADLTVIGGDVEAGGLLGTLATVITDLFLYEDDHDLVVDTRYMFGGAPRRGGCRFMFDHGDTVNHFHYFKNPKTAEQVLRGLRGAPEGFKPYQVEIDTLDDHFYRARSGGPMPAVFVLPGIMGSHLSVGGNRIWIDLLDLAGGGLVDRLHIAAPNVVAEAPVAKAYQQLLDFLGQTHAVHAFAYDWRQSIFQAAAQLATQVEKILGEAESTKQPVHLVAHSMGGLVARALIAQYPNLWARLCQHPDSRLVMLGTPNGGSYVIPRLLLGEERTVRQLALLDIRHSARELMATIAAFPGVLEMLPHPTEGLDFFEPATWRQILEVVGNHGVAPAPVALAAAKSVRARLATVPLDPRRVVYVAGSAPATPCALQIEPKLGIVQFLATPCGDGRVPWDSGIPGGIPVYYVPAEHGDLADYDEGFEAIRDLLRNGTTSRLSREPLVDARGVADKTPLPADVVPGFPDATNLTAAALGGGSRPRSRRKEAAIRKIEVGIAHGSLAFLSDPVAVGHYQGDAIVSAEDYLDRVLGGRMRGRHALGLYPGVRGSVEVFLNLGSKPGGAVVIGLGKVGELSPGSLRQAFTRAVLEYAIAVEEAMPGQEPLSLGLASVLIGSSAGGFGLEHSLTSILEGVLEANALLERRKRRARLARLEFIEMYQDLAIQAAHVLRHAVEDPQLNRHYALRKELMRPLAGGCNRAVSEESAGWWSRLQVTETEGGELRFALPTERARAEVALVPTQRAVADRLLAEATAGTRLDPALGGTLFEILVPNRLKELAPEQRDLILQLDAAAARYPWEMLFDPLTVHHTPLAIQAGLLRQLETNEGEGRERPVMAGKLAALVVGDPDTKLPSFPRLPGARAEAREVARLLQANHYAVEAVIDGDAATVLRALFAQPYRVLHLAGHGVFEYPAKSYPRECPTCQDPHECREKVNGMVLGDGSFLTSALIEQMRRVPEFVFVNCCHLGNTAGEGARHRHRLAASLAAQLIRMGVRAVVAAGWEVDDKAALTFARELYTELLNGTKYGEAVHLARKETYQAHGSNVNTWGAYQCYGNPDFSLDPESTPSRLISRNRRFVAPREPMVELSNLVSYAKTANEDTRPLLGRTLEQIESKVAEAGWIQDGDVQAALGEAAYELGRFETATAHFRAALADPAATRVPIRALEQLANAEARWGAKLAQATSPSKPTAQAKRDLKHALELIASAKRRIKILLGIEPTGERLSLKARVCKCGVLAHLTAAERRHALREMQQAYRAAADHKIRKQERDAYYPLINWMDATLLLGKVSQQRSAFDRAVREARVSAENEEAISPAFRNRIAQADLSLREQLADGVLVKHVPETARKFLDVLHGSPCERDSVLDTLRFLRDILDAQKQKTPAKAVTQVLAIIEQSPPNDKP